MPIHSTPENTKPILYRDFITSFDSNPDTGALLTVTNEESVKQSIRSLLLTRKYERPRQPDFGGNLNDILFEQNDVITESIVQKKIISVIEEREPRANILSVLVKGIPDTHQLNITITFYTVNVNDPTTFTIVLERVR